MRAHFNKLARRRFTNTEFSSIKLLQDLLNILSPHETAQEAAEDEPGKGRDDHLSVWTVRGVTKAWYLIELPVGVRSRSLHPRLILWSLLIRDPEDRVVHVSHFTCIVEGNAMKY